jgi:hypothetical protein
MASLSTIFQGGFDANAVEPDAGRDFELMPAGAYEAEISNAEVKDTKTGTGCYLSLELTILGPSHAGRKVWANITLKNANAQAESIGQAQLSSLCRAVGLQVLSDSDQLFQRILRIRLKVTPAKGDYPAKNDVSAYEAMGTPQGLSPSAARPAANTAAAPAAGGKPAAPWAKK